MRLNARRNTDVFCGNQFKNPSFCAILDRADAERCGIKNKMMTPAIQTFVTKILKCDAMTTRQTAFHEAGHRFFWGAMFPEIKTKYSVVNGLPAVIRKSGNHNLSLEKLTVEDASRYVYIKLGGVAAEMVLLGIENEAEEIADFIANDFLAENSTLDWKDDAEHGGDISDAFALIRSKTDPNPESVKQNFKAFLQSCVKNILSNRDIFDKECSEAVNLFSVWRNQGRWRPE